MPYKKSIISIAVGSAFAATLGAAPIAAAADNPFAAQPMDRGYMLAQAKTGEGKRGSMKATEGMCGVKMADTNKDMKVSKEEWIKHHEVMFEHMDANKDGFVDQAEFLDSNAPYWLD